MVAVVVVNADGAIVVEDSLGATGGMNVTDVYVLEFADPIMNGVTFPKLVSAVICTQQLSTVLTPSSFHAESSKETKSSKPGLMMSNITDAFPQMSNHNLQRLHSAGGDVIKSLGVVDVDATNTEIVL